MRGIHARTWWSWPDDYCYIIGANPCGSRKDIPMKLEVSQNVSLTPWEDGTIRIIGTRITLDVIINQFKLGATAEQIYDSFPAASLRDIYGAIYYYLAHTDAVESYMRE